VATPVPASAAPAAVAVQGALAVAVRVVAVRVVAVRVAVPVALARREPKAAKRRARQTLGRTESTP
jgi:hypothetical protein